MRFQDLQRLVAFTTDPRHGSFYRSHFKMADDDAPMLLKSMEDWIALPILQKDDLIAIPLSRRSYKPLRKLDHLRASSGTSGKPPLFSPRTHVNAMDYRRTYHDFKRPFLAFTVPLMPHWHEQYTIKDGLGPSVITHDPLAPAVSARLAKSAGVDALSVFVYHIVPLGEAMKKEGVHTDIRFIEITGEICSRAQYDYMRATFPNATILQSYNSSEVEDAHVGMPCKVMDGSEPLAVYHPKATHYLEIIDPTSGKVLEPDEGVEGDLIISTFTGEDDSFPLVRYRIGDTVRVVQKRCQHGSWSFTVIGRTDMDFVKVPGGILRADEISRVLRTLPEHVSDDFELQCSEVQTENGPRIKATLYLEPRSRSASLHDLSLLISSLIRVAPTMTYADGVRLGRYLELECLRKIPTKLGKTRRITFHG